MTPDELVSYLEDCVRANMGFEIGPPNAKALLEYIRELESAAADPRHVG